MRYFTLFSILLASSINAVYAQNQAPQINNLIVTQHTNLNYVTFDFDVSDTENDSVTIKLAYSADGGEHFYYVPPANELSGDILSPILPGADKHLTWSYATLGSLPENIYFKLIADDRQTIDIQTIVDAVDVERIIADMGFVEGIRHYTANPTHIAAIKDSLEDRFNAAGLTTIRQPFTFGAFDDAENIIGTHKGQGKEQEICIIDAHFDSVNNAPGADDNGSGVVGVMEAMRVLAPYQFERSLQFIGFDLEESGLKGSIKYVTDGIAAQENIVGVLNYEMIGYYTDEPNSQTVPAGFNILYPDLYAQLQADQFRGNFLTSIANIDSNPLKAVFDSCAAAYVPALKVMSLAIPGNGEIAPDFRRSDHAPFWDTDRQALMLTDGANFRNPNYHTTNDVSSVLDFDFMANNIKAVVATAATLARPTHSTAVISPVNQVTAVSATAPASCLSLSPNPARGQVQLSWRGCSGAARPKHVQLYDNNGKCVKNIPIPTAVQEMVVPLDGLPSGTYYVASDKGEKIKMYILAK